MATPKGWSNIGNVGGTSWEAKQPSHGRFIMLRPVGTTPNSSNPDDPHIRVDLDANGNPKWDTFHSSLNGYFGMREVIRTAITVALGS